MPSIQDIKRRIKSVGNIKQLTRAMQLVATSKMKRAEARSSDADAFSYGAREILENITRIMRGKTNHPFWFQKQEKNICLILITSNRGFCGGLNISLFNSILPFLKKRKVEGISIEIVNIGKKARNFIKNFGLEITADFSEINDAFSIKEISPIAYLVTKAYRENKTEAVYLAFNQFVNILTQKPILLKILPITLESLNILTEPDSKALNFSLKRKNNNEKVTAEYIFEPDIETVFEKLVPYLIEIELYKALLETRASEYSARMIAMKNATDKAGELIDDLNLTYNQARQASITKEIAEISSGAITTKKPKILNP